jgi:hypothetical protein
MKYIKLFEKFKLIIENEEFKSHYYSELIDIDEISKEFSLNPDDIKNWIDELQEKREESHQNLIKNRHDLNDGKGFVNISKSSAKKYLIEYLVHHKKINGRPVLVASWLVGSEYLMNRGVKPGPEFGKIIKDFRSQNDGIYMTPEKYEESLDKFFKKRGY